VEERFFGVTPVLADSDDDPPQLACLGTLCHHKNQNWLIRALAPLQKEFQFTLNLYGAPAEGTPYAQEFYSLLSTHGSWIRFHGHIPRSKLPEVYAQSSLILTPSLEDNCPWWFWKRWPQACPSLAQESEAFPTSSGTGDRLAFREPERGRFPGCASTGAELTPKLKRKGGELTERCTLSILPEQIALRHLQAYKEILSLPAGS
jgi:hypothetical protein